MYTQKDLTEYDTLKSEASVYLSIGPSIVTGLRHVTEGLSYALLKFSHWCSTRSRTLVLLRKDVHLEYLPLL